MDNNVFIYDVLSGSSSTVTTDGQVNLLYNGIPDSVYEGMAIQINVRIVITVYIHTSSTAVHHEASHLCCMCN